jgi:hypothetical protein
MEYKGQSKHYNAIIYLKEAADKIISGVTKEELIKLSLGDH